MTPVEALQATLAGEHAAVYVYGVVGGRVPDVAEPSLAERVRAAYTLHRGRRDQVVAMLRAQGADPAAAEVSYQLPTPARTTRQLVEAARLVEERSAAAYADLVGNSAGAHRQWALDALTDAAVRALGFGAEPEPFPGIAEL